MSNIKFKNYTRKFNKKEEKLSKPENFSSF
jgi:hypothetical protein